MKTIKHEYHLLNNKGEVKISAANAEELFPQGVQGDSIVLYEPQEGEQFAPITWEQTTVGIIVDNGFSISLNKKCVSTGPILGYKPHACGVVIEKKEGFFINGEEPASEEQKEEVEKSAESDIEIPTKFLNQDIYVDAKAACYVEGGIITQDKQNKIVLHFV